MKKSKTKLLLALLTFLSVSFCFAQGTVTSFTLVNSTYDTDIMVLQNGDHIYLDEHVNIRANTSGATESVKFYINDVHFSTQNEPPYALAGDNNGDYAEWMKTLGNKKITAVPYSQNNGMGTAGTPKIVNVVVVSSRITYTLVNADTDADIAPLINGQTLNLALLPANLNIRANSSLPNTESVKFDFTGTSFDRIENEAPYALFTDVSGDYQSWCCPEPGTYNLSGIPYTGNNATGTAGEGRNIVFRLVDLPVVMAEQILPPLAVTSLTLVNSVTDADIRTLMEGDTVYTDEHVNIRANIVGDGESVRFYLNGSLVRTENEPPYALAGDDGGDYNEWMKSPGNYQIVAIPYPQNNAMGTAGASYLLNIKVLVRTHITFTLVNADTDTDIGPLTNNQVIYLPGLPTENLNIRANSSMPNTESINLNFTGTSFDRIENEAPYAMFTDVSGDYKAWCCPEAGTYTISGIPYTGNNATGTAGLGNTVTFYILTTPLRTAALETYPNPAESTITISVPDGSMESAEVVITDLTGRQYFSGKMEIPANGSELNLTDFNMSPGIYLVKATSGSETRVSRMIKK